jgi:quercetin dioxygenase-like cupin family protein
MMKNIDISELGRGKVLKMEEIIDYVPNAVVIYTIIKRNTGNITAISMDSGEILAEKKIPFEIFIMIIEGKAEIVIEEIFTLLQAGESIIIPAHSSKIIKAIEKFKMISTIIKSGYE